MTTYSLDEATALICGIDSPARTKWLARRLRTGQLPGYKAGRQWRMTEDDIAVAIDKLRPRTMSIPDVPSMSGLTRTSARKLAS